MLVKLSLAPSNLLLAPPPSCPASTLSFACGPPKQLNVHSVSFSTVPLLPHNIREHFLMFRRPLQSVLTVMKSENNGRQLDKINWFKLILGD